MAENKLTVHARDEFGKGAARRARRAGQIPAVVYGHGENPLHILLPELETARIVRHANALVDLDLEGTSHLAIVKDVQRDPVLQIIEHIDLLTVRRGEKISVDVSVSVEGEPAPGVEYTLEGNTVTVEAEATHLPQGLTVSVEGRGVGEHVTVADLELPAKVEVITDPETILVNLHEPLVQDLGEEDETETEAVAEEAAAESEAE